jgi:hypothetical protein
MRKVSIVMAIVMALTVMTASVALADPPADKTTNAACSEFDTTGWTNHGNGHIKYGYVADAGNASIHGDHTNPAHFNAEVGPGATFCNQHGKAAAGPVTPPGHPAP